MYVTILNDRSYIVQLAADDKPDDVPNGTKLITVDDQITWIFYNGTWYDQTTVPTP